MEYKIRATKKLIKHCSKLYEANKRWDLKFKKLLKAGADPDVCFEEGEPVLCKLVKAGKSEAVENLLKAGANPNVSERFGRPVLFTAVNGRNIDIVETLLKHGADVNSIDDEGYTALHTALFVRYPNENTIRQLLNAGANVNEIDCDGCSVLFFALMKYFSEIYNNQFEDILKILLDAGADANADCNPLLLTLSSDSNESIAKILKQYGARVDNNYITALNVIAKKGHQDLVGKLLMYLGMKNPDHEKHRYIIPTQIGAIFGITVPRKDNCGSIINMVYNYIDSNIDWQFKLLRTVCHPRSSSTADWTQVNSIVTKQSNTAIGYFLDNRYQFDCGMGTEGTPRRSGVFIVQLVNESVAKAAGELMGLASEINEKIIK